MCMIKVEASTFTPSYALQSDAPASLRPRKMQADVELPVP